MSHPGRPDRPPLRLGDRRVTYSPAAPPDYWVTTRCAGGPVSYTVGWRVYDELAESLQPWEGPDPEG